MDGAKAFAFAVGVGHNENPSSVVLGADRSGGQRKRHAGIPAGVQIAPHDGHPIPPSGFDVFNDDGAGSEPSDDPQEFPPQSGLRSIQSPPSSHVGAAEILAREAPADQIDGAEILRAHGPHVGERARLGPVAREDRARRRIDLDVP